MKPRSLLTGICSLLYFYSFAQLSVSSTTGYSVNIVMIPTLILPSSISCAWGYNYNVRANYVVSFSGTNIPSSLYTLQGTIDCNSTSNYFSLPTNGGIGIATTTSNPWTGATDCATSTVLTMNCRNVNIHISGLGISDRTVSFPVNYTALPVTLLNFEAIRTNSKVNLSWQTATETNNAYFLIERSADAGNWTALKQLQATGNSNTLLTYRYTDNTPLAEKSYYRLKLVDQDGKSSYSDVKLVDYSGVARQPRIYPVPATGNKLTIDGIDYRNNELTMLTTSGVVVFTTKLQSLTIDLPSLPAGLYIVQLRNIISGKTDHLNYVKL